MKEINKVNLVHEVLAKIKKVRNRKSETSNKYE